MYNVLIVLISFFAAYGIVCFIVELTKLLRKKYNYKVKITMTSQSEEVLNDSDRDYLKEIITDRCICEKIFGADPDINIDIINSYDNP